MSYTEQDHQIDAEESCSSHGGLKALCWVCIKDDSEWAARQNREKWLDALRGNWTCLGCGAEIGAGHRRTCGDGCARCAPLFSLINGEQK